MAYNITFSPEAWVDYLKTDQMVKKEWGSSQTSGAMIS